jgi:hypothetical protein
MSARDLCKRYPERFISQCKIWTPKRNTIETEATHEPLIGELLAVLVSVSAPRNDAEREAMQRLHDVLYSEADS